MADKKYTKLPGVHQTPVIKNFFETTVEQLFSKSEIDSVSGYIGSKDANLYDSSDTYVVQPNVEREKFSLEPVVNTLEPVTGKSTNRVFWSDFVNILKSYGVDTTNQNSLFDSTFYSFLPPISIDKFINYQEYFWSPEGPTAIIISGTAEDSINIDRDIIGKSTYTSPNGITFKNGMVVTFSGDYVIPQTDMRYIVEGVGDSIILHNKEQNYATTFSTEDFIPFDQTIIDETDELILTTTDPNDTRFLSGGLSGVSDYVYYADNGQLFEFSDLQQVDADTGGLMWADYVAPAGTQLVYTVGGEGAFDVDPFDSGNTQTVPDYILMQRGAKDNNVWSRINFWHHKQNFIDAGDLLPQKENRAMRPIIEFDRDIELYNFGSTGVTSVEIAAYDVTINEVLGRPNGASVDSVSLSVGSRLIFPNAGADVAPYIYEIVENTTATLAQDVTDSNTIELVTQNPDIYVGAKVTSSDQSQNISGVAVVNVDSSTVTLSGNITAISGTELQFSERVILKRISDPRKKSILLEGELDFVPYTPMQGDIISVKFGAKKQGIEYFWNIESASWVEGQGKDRVNTPILFTVYDQNKISLSDEIVYPGTNCKGNKIFNYTTVGNNSVADPVLGFPLQYENFNNFSEISYTNFLDKDTIGYTPFGSSDTKYVSGYKYYKKVDSNGNTLYDTMWRQQTKPNRLRVEDRRIISEADSESVRVFIPLSTKPENSENSIRLYVNGTRSRNFSYEQSTNSVVIVDHQFNKGDIIDIRTETSTGVLQDSDLHGLYEIPLSWNSNLKNSDVLTIASPQYTEHFYNLIKDQEEFSGDAFSTSNITDLKMDPYWAQKIVQTDEELATSAFLFSNDNFNLKDAIEFSADEYVKFKNRLNGEIERFINENDISDLSYGECLEFVLDSTSTYNQGKNVFSDTYVLAHGDKKLRETVIVNNVLRKEYILSNYVDISKIENTVYVYDQDTAGKNKLLVADTDYSISRDNSVITVTFTDQYTLTLGNTLTFDVYDNVRDTVNIPPTPSILGMYPVYKPHVITDTTFQDTLEFVVGHDGSRTLLKNDVHDHILLEFEIRVYNNIMQTYRDNDSELQLNFKNLSDGFFRQTGRKRERVYNLLRHSFNKFVSTNNLDYFANDFYSADNEWTWNYNPGNETPGHWRGLFEFLYDTQTPNTAPWEMLGFTKQPTWWETQYGTDYGLTNTLLWQDLEQGIIRHGIRENLTNNRYLENDNAYSRPGLSDYYPIDEAGMLLSPYYILSTDNTAKSVEWNNTITGTATIGNSIRSDVNGLNVSEFIGTSTGIDIVTEGFVNHPVGDFPNSDNSNKIEYRIRSYTIPVYTGITTQLGNATARAEHFSTAESIGNSGIGVAVNGVLITSVNTGVSHSLDSGLHYNAGFANRDGRDSFGGAPDNNNTYGYTQPNPAAVNLTEWNNSAHSPIVGWAFDGLPIYGPYGYHDRLNNASAIRRLTSSYVLRTGVRDSDVGGAYTGEFIQDFEFVEGEGDLDQFNGRYGVTPEFPNGTYYYVATLDSDNKPAYPYTVGPKFAQAPLELANNASGQATTNIVDVPTYRVISQKQISVEKTNADNLDNGWRFGDGAPVEHSWKMTSAWPFAVTQALLLSKPGKFASIFSKPQNITIAGANAKQIIDKSTNRRFKIQSTDIHGNKHESGDLITATGYTQFIDCYLKFRGLSTPKDFVPAFRSINSKLGHKFAGFVDKDTLTVYSDNYSTTGNSSSLILPQEDTEISIHHGPYSTTNDYTGVNITLTDRNTYKVAGFNNIKRFFEIEESDTAGPRQEVSIAGTPADFSNYDADKSYPASSIVKSGYNFYRAISSAPRGSSVTDKTVWQRLSSLPTTGGAEATLYLRGTGRILQVEYDTEFQTENELYDFLISLGRRQKAMGYSFGEFNSEINDLNDWTYSAKQFLFWSAGKWSSGNTLRLSPLAGRVFFSVSAGRISKISDVDQGQYSIVDEEGKLIRAEECEIIRTNEGIEIAALDNKQIFGIILYTDEIEHVLLVSNKTTFGDTVYDDVFGQRQERLKIRGKRTRDWNGTLSSSGYIINEDNLLANFDTLASDMERYNEIGYVPVNKPLYELSRRQYGYDERKYLREFEMTFDDQYDFYAGMIRNKGTKTSLEVLLNSDNVFIPGNVSIYDEWALRAGDFGDVDNYQTIDLKISRDEVTSEKQLISISYPEDTVSQVETVEVLAPTTKFFSRPTLEIEPPPADIPGSFQYGGGTTAKATVNINAAGTITDVEVTDPGYGYTINPAVTVVAAELLTANITTAFTLPWAVSSSYVANNGNVTGISNVFITDHFANVAQANTEVDLSSATSIEDVVQSFSDTISQITLDSSLGFSGNSTISVDYNRIASESGEEFLITFKGNDFSLVDNSSGDLENILKIKPKRYQPKQRYAMETANSTVYTDVSVTVDNVGLQGNVTGALGNHAWEFDIGSRTTIQHVGGRLTSGNISYTFAPVDPTGIFTDAIAEDNLIIENGDYTYVDVLINGTKLTGVEDSLFAITSNHIASTSTIELLDIATLPGGELPADSTIEVVERSTIDFVDAYQGDLPGSTLNIKVFANDALAARLKTIRTYEIYPDNKQDATILIDVDDADRLVTRPRDLSTNGLWPTTTSVDYSGITDKKYKKLPNSGYISKYSVDHQAWNIYDFESLFETDGKLASQIPDTNDTVHFAKSEHGEFDVYNIKELEGNAYIKYKEGEGTAFLYTDYSLISDAGILDGNTTELVDVDHTQFFDGVVVLKGRNRIDDYQGSLVYENGELVYSPRILSINTPVAVFSSEKLINEQGIVMSNIQYAAPQTKLISSIVPEISTKISHVEPAYTGVVGSLNLSATANVEQESASYSILRRAEISTTTQPFNGITTFSLSKGQIDGVQVNDSIRIESDHPTAANITGNMYRVAAVDTGSIRLYANVTTLAGVDSTIPRANVQFVNYGQHNFEGNSNVSGYSVQVYSKAHNYDNGDSVQFTVPNVNGAAGDTFKVSDVTPNTFRIVSGSSSANNVLTNNGIVKNVETEVKITANMSPSEDTTIQKYLIPGGYVTFTDLSGSPLDGNTFEITDVEKQVVIGNPDGTNNAGDFVVTGETYSDTVETVNGNVLSVTNGESLAVEPGMYLETELGPSRVEEVTYKSDVSAQRSMYVQAFVDFATADYSTMTESEYALLASEFQDLDAGVQSQTFVLNEELPGDIIVGDRIEIIGIVSPEDNVTVTNISGKTITVSKNVLVKHNTVVTFTHVYPDRMDSIILDTSVDGLINVGDPITFVDGGYNDSNPGSRAINTVFTIAAPALTANVDQSNLSFKLVNSTNVVFEDSVVGLYNKETVKLIDAGNYSGFQEIQGVDPVNNTLLFDLPYVDVINLNKIVPAQVTDSNIINVGVDEYSDLVEGYLITSNTATIPADTRVVSFDNTGNIQLSSNVTIPAGSSVTFTEDRWRYASMVNGNILITTNGDHEYSTDGTSRILGKEITIADFAPNYYNWSWKVVDIPSTTTVKVVGYGFNKPVVVGTDTYISQKFYDTLGEEAFKVDGKDSRELLPFFWFNHDADIEINGAQVFKGVYPFFGVSEYTRELKRIKEQKEGAVFRRGSFGMIFPSLDGNGNFSSMTPAQQQLINDALSTGHIPVNPNIGGAAGNNGRGAGSNGGPGGGGRGGYGGNTGGGNTGGGNTGGGNTGAPIPVDNGNTGGGNTGGGNTGGGNTGGGNTGGGGSAPDPVVTPPATGAQDPIQMMYDQLGSGTMTPSEQEALITSYMGFAGAQQAVSLLPNQVLQTMPQAGYALAAQGTSVDGGFSLGGPRFTGDTLSYGPMMDNNMPAGGTLSDLLTNNFANNSFTPYTPTEAAQQMIAGSLATFYAAVGYTPPTTSGDPQTRFKQLLGTVSSTSTGSSKSAMPVPGLAASQQGGLTFGGGYKAPVIGLVNKNALIDTGSGKTTALNVAALNNATQGSCTPTQGLLANASVGYNDPVCTQPPQPPGCGPGTHMENGVCVPDKPTCGADEVYNDTTNQCEPIVVPPPPIQVENMAVYWDNKSSASGDKEETTFLLTENDSQNYIITVYLNHFGAADKVQVYQSQAQGSQRVEVGGINNSGTHSTVSNLSSVEKSMFMDNRQLDPDGSPASSSPLKDWVPEGSSPGFGKFAGKFTFTYDATQGRYITFVTDSKSSSYLYEYTAQFPINEGETALLSGSQARTGNIPSTGRTATGGPRSTSNNGGTVNTNTRQGIARSNGNPRPTLIPRIAGAGITFSSPTNAADANGVVYSDPFANNGFNYNSVNTIAGPVPTQVTGQTAAGPRTINYQQPTAGTATGNVSAIASNNSSSIKAQVPGTNSPVLTVKALKKDNNGKYYTAGQADVPLCEPKPRIPLCPDTFTASDDPRSISDGGFFFDDKVTNDRLYSVSPGDSFKVNGVVVQMAGVNTIDSLVQAINAAGSAQISSKRFEAYRYNNNGTTCVMISPKGQVCEPAPISLANGCGTSGNLKEVSQYTLRGDVDHAFSESSSLAGTSTRTSSVTINRPPMTAKTSDDPPVVVANPGDFGSTNTTSSGTNYIYNTITAQQKRAAHKPSTITVTNGSGYRLGDEVRVVGGIPATLQDAMSSGLLQDKTPGGVPYAAVTSIIGLRVVNPGSGYKQGQLKIIINGACSKKARIDYNTVQFNSNGGIVGVGAGGSTSSMILMQTKNGIPDNNGYSSESARTTVSVIGSGTGAEFEVVHITQTFNSSQNTSLQELQPARFQVTSVDPLGGILGVSMLYRGVYTQFPSDLDSGLPLIGGGGTGGRIFLTAKALPDCTSTTNTLSKFGVSPGIYNPPTPTEHFINTLNDYAPISPDGFPMYTASLDTGPGGVPAIVIQGDDIDGIEFADPYSPGLLTALNLPTGATTVDPIPEIEEVDDDPEKEDGTSLGDLSNPDGTGTLAGDTRTNPDQLNKGVRFSYPQAGNASGPNVSPGSRFALDNVITPYWSDTRFEGDIYEYRLSQLDGQSAIVPVNTANRQRVDVHALESLRHTTEANLDLANISHAWIDNYNNQGWAYLQNGVITRKQEPLVDIKLIRDAFSFDELSAEKEFDISLYDPFKGIIPGFIDKEIDYTTQTDPVVYNMTRSSWGKKQVGRRWWDTSLVRYNWYEQGSGTYGPAGYNNTERTAAWGEMFPGSTIRIYEWVESIEPPASYTGGGIPIDTGNFVQQQFYNKSAGKATVYYYFWVYGLETVGNTAMYNLQKERPVVEIERLLTNINAERVSYAGYISPDSMVVNQLGPLIKTEGSIISTQFLRREESDTEKHTSWLLSAEGDPNSSIPSNLSIKLIDSLSGYNAIGDTVPGEGLSAFERYGSKFRPRQTMFKDLQKSRKQMFDVLNAIFKELKMQSTFIDWQKNLPAELQYLQQTNWYEQQRVNSVDNSVVYYDDTYRPLRKVTDTTKFALIKNLIDKSIIQVQKSDSAPYQLYEYSKKSEEFKLIAMENETVQWKSSIYTDPNSVSMGTEIRKVLDVLYSSVFVNTFEIYWNKFFFEMMKYAYSEQGELDWAFKTTYLNIIKEETDLVPLKGFKVDNFDKAIEYFNDVKPYSSKIRNYLDIKRSPVELLKGSTTDFDRPPYYDEDAKEVRILDESNPIDVDILNTDKNYAGFVSTNSRIRQTSTQIVFDRVKGSLYQNATGGKIETFRADGLSNGFSFNTDIDDVTRLQVKVDGELVPERSFDNELISNVVGTVETITTQTEANVNRQTGTFNNMLAISDFGTSITVDLEIDTNGAIADFSINTTTYNHIVGDKFVVRDQQLSNIVIASTTWDMKPWDTDPNNPGVAVAGTWDEEIGQVSAPDIEFTTAEISNVSIITDRTSSINSNSTIEFTDGPMVSLYGETYFIDVNQQDTVTIFATGNNMPIDVSGVQLTNVMINGVNAGNTSVTVLSTTSDYFVVSFDDLDNWTNPAISLTSSDIPTITSGTAIYQLPEGGTIEADITAARYNQYNDTKIYSDSSRSNTVSVSRVIDYRNVSGTFGQITSVDPTINYTVNSADNFITFTNDIGVNNRIGIPQNGALIELTYFEGFDPTMETVNVSIAKNLVNIESNSIANIGNVQQEWTASERVYKFNPEVRQAVTAAFETEYGSGATTNANIIQNISVVTSMIDSGKLDPVLNMVRDIVGAGLNAAEIDGKTFLDIVPGQHPSYVYNDTLGLDVYGWDTDVWDSEIDVENFVGIFNENTQGNVNYRIDNETVYGFDGTTFLKHRTGPDRPEELAVVEPLETLVMDITTLGDDLISPTSGDVRFLMLMDLFGNTDYYRRTVSPIATVAQLVNNWEDEIFLNDVLSLPETSQAKPARIWINGELISYTRISVNNNSISGITRGIRGTTINLILQVDEGVYNGQETENIRLRSGSGEIIRDPEDLNWLKPVEVFSTSVPLDENWDGSGSLSAAGLTYDAGSASVGLDPTWDGTGGNVIEFTSSGHTLTYDIDEEAGWDAATESIKKATSLTDRGDVLKSVSSIVDFLHNFDSN